MRISKEGKVRVGIIGMGNMGNVHAEYIIKGEVPEAELTAVCDIDREKLKIFSEKYGEGIKTYSNIDELLTSGTVDGVIVANLHYSHPQTAIKAFENGLHVLIEKPAGVYTKQVEEMNIRAKKSGKIFGIMFNERVDPLFQKLRDLVKSGEIGEIKRTNWIITDWYRSQSYYDSSDWRATWSKEGGGVLLNQCAHQMDIWQWICGMPEKVRAYFGFGKYHNIEVEDDVTIYVEYKNKATGVFISSTGECPGSNRFEIAGNNGKVVIEEGRITFWRLRTSERQFNSEFKGGHGHPEIWKCEIPTIGKNTYHAGITRNWIDAILKDTPLIAPGIEGINSLQISNAAYLSAWTNEIIEIPVDEDIYYEQLRGKIDNCRS